MNSQLPRVSVLMATYNGERWLREQIDSILNQKNVSVRIEISDDGSKDRTLDLISEIKLKDDRLNLIDFPQNAGSASANFFRLMMNVDVSHADYFAFSDQDDVWLPEKLQRAVSFLNSKDVSGYSCATLAFWPDGREKVMLQNSNQRKYDYFFEGAGQGCTFVLKKDLFLAFVDFLRLNRDELKFIHYHDWFLYAFSRLSGCSWYFDPEPMLRYRQHEFNDTGARGSLSGVYSRFEKIRNGWYRKQLESILKIFLKHEDFNKKCAEVNDRLFLNKGPWSNFNNALWILKNGRRRMTDRGFLAITMMLGWI